jgi:mutator protein MutT
MCCGKPSGKPKSKNRSRKIVKKPQSEEKKNENTEGKMIEFKVFLEGKLKKAACVAIINAQNKILLVRRSKTAEWMPLHYCLPGGHVEKGEKPIDAAKREAYEETGIELNKNNMKLETIEENNGFINYIFVSHITSTKVNLNLEHDEYIWCSLEKCDNYNLVPKLSDIICKIKNELNK